MSTNNLTLPQPGSFPRSGFARPIALVIRTPGGAVIGTVRREGSRVTFVRSISSKARPRVLFRENDSWPLGATALTALQACGCTHLLYRAPEGAYATSLTAFVEQAVRRVFLSNPEPQYLMPRSLWGFTPRPQAVSDGQTFLALPMESPSWAR